MQTAAVSRSPSTVLTATDGEHAARAKVRGHLLGLQHAGVLPPERPLR